MKVSDGIAKFLKLQGIDYIFELSGGMITHLLDSLSKEKINIVTMHHEQAAAFAAEGFARVTRLPSVALATSGPGATNLVTGIGSCYFDSVPTIFITGQVNTHEQKGDRQIRQLGFQETDIVSMVKPITKGAFSIDKADQVPEIFEKAFKLAVEGRPGPVLIDVPMNIQRSDVIWNLKNVIVNEGTSQEFVSDSTLNEIVNDILDAKFPLILVGGGIRSAKAVDQFRRFVSLTKLPVVTSLMGVDALPFDSPQRVGFIGSYGNRWANMAIGKSDFILVLGSRLDIRQTGANTDFFKGGRKIVHVDCEEGEINNRVVGCVKIVCDLKVFLHKVNSFVGNQTFELKHDWNSKLQHLKSEWPDTKEIKEINGINPNEFMHQLSQGSKSCSAFITDVGNHQMWSAQSLELAEGQLFLTSGGMGAMGFALPTAIGAVFATKKSPVIVIAGDGGIQLNIQELQTIVRNKLPIKVIILNNKTLGMIRQFQDSYFEGRYQSTLWGYDTPDFEAVGKAYGINAKTISKTAEIDEAISWLWIDPHSPSLLQVMIDTFTNVYPKIAFGKPITEMEPLSKPIEMEGT